MQSEYQILSKQELAEWLGYTTRTIDRMVAARKIPFTSLPSTGNRPRIRFVKHEIQAWIDDNKVEVMVEVTPFTHYAEAN